MQALCATPNSSSIDAFVASAGLAVEFTGSDERMRLAGIDRRGFIVGVTDDAQLPPLGVPRQGRIAFRGETLCEPRLVARCAVHGHAPACEIILQPSRSDDDIAFWQALYAHRLRQRAAAGGRPAGGRDSLESGHPTAPKPVASAVLTDGEAIFLLRNADDAAFFGAWLEYHFAEAVARARAASSPADLRDMACQTDLTQVTVRFEYRSSGKSTHAATRETCAWVAAEVEHLFGLGPRYELASAHERTGAISYRQRPPTRAS